jgi:ribosomal protein L6P/L9E
MNFRKLIFLKKKKMKILYLEDLYANSKHLLSSSEKGINSLHISFPEMKMLNNHLFYAPLHCSLRVSISIIVKQVKLFLKGLTQGFFLEFRMIGLGFKVKRAGNFSLRSIKLDIGFSHFIKIPLSNLVKLFRIKRRFLLFSIDYVTLKILLKQIQNLRKHNPYKMRGLKLTGVKFRVKPGKKQTKR